MKRTLLFGALAGALLLAGLAAWMLSGEPEAPTGANALRRARDVAHEAPGFRSGTAENPPAAAEPVRVDALPAAADAPVLAAPVSTGPVRRLAGRVVRLADDSPLGGVVVARVVTGENGVKVPAPGGVTTEATDGSFTLEDVPVAGTEVCVTFSDAVPRQTAFYPLPDVDGDIDGLELTYDSGFLLRGSVTDTAGTPLAGASVGLTAAPVARTDAAGRFELRDVVTTGGRFSVDVWAQAPWYARDTRAVTAPADSHGTATVTFVLQGSGAIEGRVTDARGAPVSATEVRIAALMTAEHGQAGRPFLVARTGDDGRYRLDHVPEGRYLVQVGIDGFAAPVVPGDPSREDTGIAILVAQVEHSALRGRVLAPRWIPDVEVRTGHATTLDVELNAGAVIEGHVTDASGVRLPGAKVTLERLTRWAAPEQTGSAISFDGTVTITSRGGGAPGVPGETVLSVTERTAETDAEGAYRFTVVSAGSKRLTVIDAAQRCSPQKREFVVAGTESHAAMDFVLDFGLSVRGRVTDPAGRPLEGASANIKPEGTQMFSSEGAVTTDADGWFEAVGLGAGPHSMMLNKLGYAHRFESVQPGEVPRTRVMQPAPKVHGRVVDTTTGKPILRFSIAVERENSSMQSGHEDHAEGRFTVDVNDDTPCTIRVNADGYGTESREGVIPTLTAASPLEFRMKPGS